MREEARTPLWEEIKAEVFAERGLQLFVLRLDLLHPHISGNKWFKLKYNLQEARAQRKDTLLTFGGAYSNHIVATAAAAKEQGFHSIGIIRGEEERALNERLRFTEECGMQLHFISREAYRNKEEDVFLRSLEQQFGSFYLLPEGGANGLAVQGCREILRSIDVAYDIVCCSCGTGTTLAGIALSLDENKKAIGFSSLKGGAFLEKEVSRYTGSAVHNWSIQADYHFGGYAKSTPGLLSFIKDFRQQHNIELDPVYTGKMMVGIFDLAANGYFRPGSRILAVHTGGLFLTE